MQKVNHTRGKWWNAVFLLIGLLIIVADQLSKTWIRANLARGHSLFDIGFFRITHVRNTGAAFGLFQDQSLVLTIIGIAVVVTLLICSRFIHGGTVGNMIDRLRLGYVTDFIDFSYWPAFNIADSAITVGVIIFAYAILRSAQSLKQ